MVWSSSSSPLPLFGASATIHADAADRGGISLSDRARRRLQATAAASQAYSSSSPFSQSGGASLRIGCVRRKPFQPRSSVTCAFPPKTRRRWRRGKSVVWVCSGDRQTTGGVGFLLPRSEREVSRASEAAVAKYCDGEWQMTKIRDGGRAAAVEGGPGRSSD